jgi:SNF2 family DNA or RNA helicase
VDTQLTSLHVDQWPTKPYKHQVLGVDLLVNHEYFGIFDQMGCGKSAQVVNSACELALAREIDTVLIVAPASVRGVWLDPDMGEIRKHAWYPSRAYEFHSRGTRLVSGETDCPEPLEWFVTNYEYVRIQKNRDKLLRLLAPRKVMMVLDESSFIKSHTAKQTRACLVIGQGSARRVILNGTPITNSPGDLWSQMLFLSPNILKFRNYYAFRATYGVLGGFQGKQVVRWQYLDDLQERIAPYVIRREKEDCLDLPEKIYTQLETPLSEANWKLYKQMREECLAWLGENLTMAAQAGVKVMRLAQITSGILGGFDQPEDAITDERTLTREIGREKLDCLIEWLKERLIENPELKIIVWCRFRKQLERAAEELSKILPTYRLCGGQPKEERERAVRTFSAGGPSGTAALVAQQQAGGFGLNLVGATMVVYLSNDFNLGTRMQSEDRVHRPGQTQKVVYLDVLAVGPKGQKTVDRAVLGALLKKKELANWTASAWKQVLESEEAAP